VDGVRAVAYAVLLVTALAAVQPIVREDEDVGRRTARPWATATAMLVVGVPTLVQLTVAPGLLRLLERNWAAISEGQLWRLGTSLVVQDGGWSGAVFNLAMLAVVGSTAEQVWGARRWLVLAVGSGVCAQFWGAVVQPVGGGNSVGVFGLAASLAVVALVRGRGPSRLLGAAALAVGTVLLVLGDLHGGATAIGAVLAAILVRRRRAGLSSAALGRDQQARADRQD
jgi:membrane associated rhomboid family serine protease